MDPYEPLHGLENYPWWGPLNFRDHPMWEPVRKNMGYARYFAERMGLARAGPRSDLSSSKYCLAQYGKEYLLYIPEREVTVNLGHDGTFALEWLDPDQGILLEGEPIAASKEQTIKVPLAGHAVLHLRRT